MGFVQGDIVYRLVWGVEAVRVHGLARNVPGAADLTGLLALVLTYGLPSAPGILLARAGLSSRNMVNKLLGGFPDVFQGQDDVRALVRALAERIDAGFWENEVSAGLWREFADRWLDPRGGAWGESEAEAQVVWIPGQPIPQVGEQVRLAHDHRDAVTYVCTDELETIGQLTLPLPVASSGSVSATVAGPDRLLLRLFTPRT